MPPRRKQPATPETYDDAFDAAVKLNEQAERCPLAHSPRTASYCGQINSATNREPTTSTPPKCMLSLIRWIPHKPTRYIISKSLSARASSDLTVRQSQSAANTGYYFSSWTRACAVDAPEIHRVSSLRLVLSISNLALQTLSSSLVARCHKSRHRLQPILGLDRFGRAGV
jgi:hypothetical protein